MLDTSSYKVANNLPSFSDYGHEFQDRIVESLFIDPNWSEQMHEILMPEYFEYEHHQFIVKSYFDYYNKYKVFPSFALFAGILKEKLNSNKLSSSQILLAETVSLLKKIKDEPNFRDTPYVKEKVLDFCKKQAMKEALLKSTDLIQQNDYDQVLEIMKKAMAAGDETAIGYDFHIDREGMYTDDDRDPIPTGIPEIDHKDVLDGGLGRGELAIIVMSPGLGKSHMLVQVGAHAVKSGFNVLHISLEMGEKKISRRYAAWFTGIDSKQIINNKDEVEEWYSSNGEKLGRLIIKEFPSSSVSANKIRSYIQRIALKKNFWPDLVVIDYADEMKSIRKFDAEASRHEFKAIYRDIRNLGRDTQKRFAVWSASQSNKEGSSADILTGENMSESFRKLDVPDFVFTAACKPENKKSGAVKGFVAKCRDGVDGLIFPMFIDRKTSRFTVISEEEYMMLLVPEKDKRNDIKKRLKNKLKDFDTEN